jgi:hypothetical protein
VVSILGAVSDDNARIGGLATWGKIVAPDEIDGAGVGAIGDIYALRQQSLRKPYPLATAFASHRVPLVD